MNVAYLFGGLAIPGIVFGIRAIREPSSRRRFLMYFLAVAGAMGTMWSLLDIYIRHH